MVQLTPVQAVLGQVGIQGPGDASGPTNPYNA